MSAELRLVLLTESEGAIEGWTVVSGSHCPAHELGMLLIVSPGHAALAQTLTPAQQAELIKCATVAFTRCLQQAFPGLAVHAVAQPVRRNNPRDS